MSDLTLVVLAAGMGSRYGSLKQMDAVGPAGEAIIDYSIYDAIRAGFTKVVFVIRHSFEKEFRQVFDPSRFGGRIEVEFVFQELDYLPDGFTVPEGREKPWGTNHAVMMAKSAVSGPFAVINADDFYGKESYSVLAGYLQELRGRENRYAMVGFQVRNTLSENGTVSRGVCGVDGNGNLVSMVERHGIERLDEGQVIYIGDDGKQQPLSDDAPVSMNMFGFTPDYFRHSEEYFKTFLTENVANLKAEYYIPTMVNKLVQDGTAQMKVLKTDAKWFGVTYKADKPMVEERIRTLIAEGVYPDSLWGAK